MTVYIEDIARYDGQAVTLKGWLHNRRSSGKIHFLTLRDGSGFIQAVMSKAAVGDEPFKAADHLSQETSLIVTGTVMWWHRVVRKRRSAAVAPQRVVGFAAEAQPVE